MHVQSQQLVYREFGPSMLPHKALKIGVEVVQQVAHDSLLVLGHWPVE